MSRSTILFYPITDQLVEEKRNKLQNRYPESEVSEEEAVIACLNKFAVKELKIHEEEFKELKKVRIYPAAKAGDSFKSIYVEFDSPESAQIILDHVRFLRKGDELEEGEHLRVTTHCPWFARDRMKQIEKLAWQMRTTRDENNQMNTRITLGEDDYILEKRKKEKYAEWEMVILPDDLPPFKKATASSTAGRSPTAGPGRSASKALKELFKANTEMAAARKREERVTTRRDGHEEDSASRLDDIVTSASGMEGTPAVSTPVSKKKDGRKECLDNTEGGDFCSEPVCKNCSDWYQLHPGDKPKATPTIKNKQVAAKKAAEKLQKTIPTHSPKTIQSGLPARRVSNRTGQ